MKGRLREGGQRKKGNEREQEKIERSWKEGGKKKGEGKGTKGGAGEEGRERQ